MVFTDSTSSHAISFSVFSLSLPSSTFCNQNNFIYLTNYNSIKESGPVFSCTNDASVNSNMNPILKYTQHRTWIKLYHADCSSKRTSHSSSTSILFIVLWSTWVFVIYLYLTDGSALRNFNLLSTVKETVNRAAVLGLIAKNLSKGEKTVPSVFKSKWLV